MYEDYREGEMVLCQVIEVYLGMVMVLCQALGLFRGVGEGLGWGCGGLWALCCLGMMRTTGGCAAELGLHGVG